MAGAPDRWRPAALKRLMRARGFVTRRHLGQHLLLEPARLQQIVDAAGVEAGDVVLEVGTGPGVLTRLLLERGAEVVGVEIDPAARALLGELIGDHARLQLVAGDVLAGPAGLHPQALAALEQAGAQGQRVLCVSNFPYHVATPLLVRLFELGVVERRFPLRAVVGTLQREVAERLAAPPGDRRLGPASVLLQAIARLEILQRLPPGAFWPPPKVHSALVRLTPLAAGKRALEPEPVAWKRFSTLVRALYPYRRKTLRNALRRGLGDQAAESAIEASGIEGGVRVETLSPAQLATLASHPACARALDVL